MTPKFPSLLHQCYWEALEAGECSHIGFVIWNDLTDETAAKLATWRAEHKNDRWEALAKALGSTPWTPRPPIQRTIAEEIDRVLGQTCKHEWIAEDVIDLNLDYFCRRCRAKIRMMPSFNKG